MPIKYIRKLTGHERDQQADRHLGYSLAFIAGAMNAGGFLAVGQYTSHMTGIVSSMADAAALGAEWIALAGFTSVLAFLAGAATTALLINWASRRKLRSRYALSLLLEAALLLLFGLAGAHLKDYREFLAPTTVLLLCFIMGLQNAIITKISGAVIRTTHVTGLSTDIGIELGKLFYVNRCRTPQPAVRANRAKLKLHTLLLCSFCSGGVLGALGFKRAGFSAAIPLALWLAVLASIPVLDDIWLRWRLFRQRR
jgi:uncharacterized membrane protein YoaK (UPF0700 family)